MTDKWERQMVQTDRGTFEVFIKGAGNPICVTHNYSEFNNSGDYFAESFTRANKVILVNMREAGNSEKAHMAYQFSMVEAVFDLEAIRQALGYNRWIFAGHSTGGMIGLIYGIHFSDSLDALILVGTAAREYASSSSSCIYNRNHPEYQLMQDLIEELKRPNLSPAERKELSKARTKLSLLDSDKYNSYFTKNIHKKMSGPRMNFFSREVLLFDVTRQLYKIKVKTLVICGRYDVQCPLTFSIEIAEGILHSTLQVFEESNHYPFLEEKELFEATIEKWFANKLV